MIDQPARLWRMLHWPAWGMFVLGLSAMWLNNTTCNLDSFLNPAFGVGWPLRFAWFQEIRFDPAGFRIDDLLFPVVKYGEGFRAWPLLVNLIVGVVMLLLAVLAVERRSRGVRLSIATFLSLIAGVALVVAANRPRFIGFDAKWIWMDILSDARIAALTVVSFAACFGAVDLIGIVWNKVAVRSH